MTTRSKGCVMKCLIVSHHFVKFSDHGPCGRAAAKISYVTLQDYLIRLSGDFIEGNSGLYIPTLPKLIAIDIVLMDI